MMQQGYGQVPVPPPAPPTQAGELSVPPRSSSWPMVIGIIAIILGALGALGGIWGAVSPLFLDALMSLVPKGAGPMPDMSYLQDWAWWTVLVSLLKLALAVLLLVAGIGLIKRVAWARGVSLTWAVLKMLLVTVELGVAYLIQQDAMAAMSQAGSQTVAMPVGAMQFGMAFGICFALVWGWALPVFMLIWFTRDKIRTEVAEWGARPESNGGPAPWGGV